MGRKNCLVKISGDMLNNKTFTFIKKLSLKYFVAICIGGGTQINRAFKEAGLPIRKFGLLGRATPTLEERLLSYNILSKNQAEIQDRLADLGIYVAVEIPMDNVATVLCPQNGDYFIIKSYHGYDLLYVVTVKKKVKEKQEFFNQFQRKRGKIRVIGF